MGWRRWPVERPPQTLPRPRAQPASSDDAALRSRLRACFTLDRLSFIKTKREALGPPFIAVGGRLLLEAEIDPQLNRLIQVSHPRHVGRARQGGVEDVLHSVAEIQRNVIGHVELD